MGTTLQKVLRLWSHFELESVVLWCRHWLQTNPVTPKSYSVVVTPASLAFSLLFRFIWLSSVGSVLRYWDLGGAIVVSSCCSANRSLSFSWRTLSNLVMRLPMRYIISQMHIKMHKALDITMNSMKIFFSVGRLMKQSTVFGHGGSEHLDNLGKSYPWYIRYRM